MSPSLLVLLGEFLLLTGLRATDAATVRWEHVDWDEATLHRPKPKGGTDRAFTVPLAAHTLEVLRELREANRANTKDFPDGDGGWAFPSRQSRGEVAPVRSPRIQKYEEGVKMDAMPSPHRLRHTFATACHEAFLREVDIKLLMNHTLPRQDKNVTQGYVHPSQGHLRGCIEKVTKFLLKKTGARDRAKQKRRAG
ncbi:MAG: tyrosine-type recombinase/integrase [Planctomycetota bacterium]